MKTAETAIITILNGGNTLAPELLARLGWACIGGGCLMLLVSVGLYLLRPTATVRGWLWWAVSIKFLAGLLPAFCAIALTFTLPHNAVTAPVLRPLTALAAPFNTEYKIAAKANASAVAPDSGSIALQHAPSAPLPPSLPVPTPLSLVLLGYFLGLLTFVIWSVRSMLAIRETVQSARRIHSPEVLALLEECVTEVGLKTVPRLYESPKVAAPLVTGVRCPCLVLPAGFAESVSPTILRLALLHELAHIRRGDLWLGLIPYTAQLLFWWFPLTWIARREWEQAREEACDDAAVTWGKRPALLYGKLLVQLATGQRFPAVNVAGLAAPGCSPLKRRLVALRRGPIILTRAQRALLAMLVLGAICAFLPFRVRATVPFPEPLALLTDRNLPQYTVVPLGTLGGEYSDAYAINDSGQAVGTMSLPEGRGHAFVATDAETRDLSADSGFPRSMAFGINTQGSVAGTAFYRSEKPNAFFWDGKRHYIGTLPGFGYSQATGVNDSGAVVGTALRFRQKWGAVQAHAWVWQNGVIQDIGTLGGEYSHAVAIDNQGRIVGKADLPRTGSEGMTHAFVWERSSGMRDLGTLPGGKNSRAQGINDGGEVVGVSEGGDGTHQAFIVTGDTVMAPLPTLPGASEAVAQSINASGQVVGNVAMGNNDAHAVLWQRSVGEKGGQVFDLNACIPAASGWHLHCARGINNRGEIVGQGDWNGKQLAFLLRPVR